MIYQGRQLNIDEPAICLADILGEWHRVQNKSLTTELLNLTVDGVWANAGYNAEFRACKEASDPC